MVKKIGIYGGSYDPIHNGHLNLAQQMVEAHNLDEVWFCPVNVSPHKLDKKAAPVVHRLEMVRLAIEPFPYFKLLDIEAKRQGPSYTIDTLDWLTENHPQDKFYFIMADDALAFFDRWKEPDRIISKAQLLIGMRSCYSKVEIPKTTSLKVKEIIEAGITPTQVMEVSSTSVRQRVTKGQTVVHLVPPLVASYIKSFDLY